MARHGGGDDGRAVAQRQVRQPLPRRRTMGIGFPMTESTEDTKRQRAIDALDRLTRLRERIERRSGVYHGDWIAEARVERDDQMGRIWSGGEQ